MSLCRGASWRRAQWSAPVLRALGQPPTTTPVLWAASPVVWSPQNPPWAPPLPLQLLESPSCGERPLLPGPSVSTCQAIYTSSCPESLASAPRKPLHPAHCRSQSPQHPGALAWTACRHWESGPAFPSLQQRSTALLRLRGHLCRGSQARWEASTLNLQVPGDTEGP